MPHLRLILLGVALTAILSSFFAGKAHTQRAWDLAEARRSATLHVENLHAIRLTERASERLEAALAAKDKEHRAIQRKLKKALDASNLRAARLAADVARLHDDAIRAANAAAAASAPPSRPGTPADAGGVSEASCADALELAAENARRAGRNAARYRELRDLYNDLRERKALTDKDVKNADP